MTNNLESVKVKELAEILSKKLGYYIELKSEIVEQRNSDKKRLTIVSNELKHQAGIMSSMYESLTIINFGGGMINEEFNNMWMSIHFSFSYIKSGSNGTEICNVWYDFTKEEWTIQN
jgi:hypothetical protein